MRAGSLYLALQLWPGLPGLFLYPHFSALAFSFAQQP